MRIFEDFCFPFEGFLFFRLARHACPAGDSLLSALEQARNGKTKGTGRHLRGKTALKQAGTSAPRRAIHHGQVTNSRAPTAAGAPQNDRTDEDGSDPAENDRAIRGYSRGILAGRNVVAKTKRGYPTPWSNLLLLSGRSDWIRTSDPLLPKQVYSVSILAYLV